MIDMQAKLVLKNFWWKWKDVSTQQKNN